MKLITLFTALIFGCITTQVNAQNSVLATGKWQKIAINKTGIYKITPSDLATMGFGDVNPDQIKVYGYGGIVPQANDEFRHGDLAENSTMMNGSDILFFGQGSDEVELIGNRLIHQKNPYSNTSFYYITTDGTTPKRVSDNPQNTWNGLNEYSTLPQIQYQEKDLTNLVKSGREWLGESFQFRNRNDFNFNLTDRSPDSDVKIVTRYVGGSDTRTTNFSTLINGEQKASSLVPLVSRGYGTKGRVIRHDLVVNTNSNSLTVSGVYNNQGDGSARGYVDYIRIEYDRRLRSSNMAHYVLNNNYANAKLNLEPLGANQRIWDVSDVTNIKQFNTNSNQIVLGNSISELVFFNTNSASGVNIIGAVNNQNLHATPSAELLIITNKAFGSVAQDFKDHKINTQGISTEIAYVDEIYNEFSSGSQDISAIRDFTKHLYEKDQKLKYLLLLGDCSYDYKDILPGNTNFVPVYQSRQSFNNTTTFSSDDYFGFFDPSEGYWDEVNNNQDQMEIAIGRIPIKTAQEGQNYLAKMKHYIANENTKGNWRNNVMFVADDGDSNLHMEDADKLSVQLNEIEPGINVSKIYLDAFEQISGSGGQKAPAVNQEINRKMDQGALIVNFTGHGSEEQWTQEEVLTISQINSFTNRDRLPFFITATCEFGRYDDPNLESGAERLLLNPDGGAIALMTTTRPVYANSNFAINTSFYNNVFQRNADSVYNHLGEINRNTKNQAVKGVNNRNFSLLGDPTLKLSYPANRVVLDSINSGVMSESDTISALQRVTLNGRVLAINNTLDPGFNGQITLTVFDKETPVVTKSERPFAFNERKSVIFEGSAVVTNGKYQIEFVVPKDISYEFGPGKFSLYAQSNEGRDASGSQNIIIGGGLDEFIDDLAPEIELYINDFSFVSGSITNPNPTFIALVSDENGLNTTNTGIGHEMTLVLNDDFANPYVLNEFYSSKGNAFNEGEIYFPLSNLSPGTHKLTFKVWDVNNNSATKDIYLMVADDAVIQSFPNPFTDRVTLHIDQPRANVGGTVDLTVYSPLGEVIMTKKQFFDSFNSVIEDVQWDGIKIGGEKITAGVYFMEASIRYEDGRGDFVQKGRLIYQK